MGSMNDDRTLDPGDPIDVPSSPGASIGEERDVAGDERDEAADERDRAADDRDDAGDVRDEAGDQRDETGLRRDEAGDARDRAADERDREAERSEARVDGGMPTEAVFRAVTARRDAASDRKRASQDRRAAAAERTQAELDRITAFDDRDAGASERTHAELDRGTALADRDASARDRDSSAVDDLTGASRRGAGFVELEHEIAKAARTNEPLVVVFVDVDHLKHVNDAHGHAAGDRMLLQVTDAIRSVLRPYDLIMRYGGDEFVCVISGLSVADVTVRFARVNEQLAAAPDKGSVTVGIAQLRPDERSRALVERADAALYRTRSRQRAHDA
jgi:diguanylate cyclase (GGDEF)-like protein